MGGRRVWGALLNLVIKLYVFLNVFECRCFAECSLCTSVFGKWEVIRRILVRCEIMRQKKNKTWGKAKLPDAPQ